MGETKFTPGPWEVGKHPAISTGAIVRPILFGAQVRVLPEWEGGHVILRNEADAYLIAAAPELYEALSLCVKSILEDLQLTGYDEDEALEHPALEAAFAALAKARGEDSK